MPSPLRRPLLALTAAAMVAGCSSVGEVNGMPVNQSAAVASDGDSGSDNDSRGSSPRN